MKDTFYGYKRPDGRVGIRNNVLILPASICASDVCRMVSDAVPGTEMCIRDSLAADGAVHDRGDLFDDLCEIPALFCDQGRIGGNAADNAHIIGFFDVFYIGCVNKKFHSKYPPE